MATLKRAHMQVCAKIIVQELVSVDGMVSDPKGGLDFFDVVSDYREADEDNLVTLSGVETVLLGRATYLQFVDYWPTAEGETVAEVVNTIPKVVFSSTVAEAPWGRFEPARVHGNAVDHVRRLRQQPGGAAMVWGSISLAQSLLAAGLVDELQLLMVPTVLGRGRSLFTEDARPGALALREAKAYTSGIVRLRYSVGPSGR